jgi:hypothetical protein
MRKWRQRMEEMVAEPFNIKERVERKEKCIMIAWNNKR